MWSKLRFEELRVKGAGINDGDSVLILDDVITSGNTQKRAIEFVRNQGGDVSGIACMLERIEGRLREVGENNGEDIKTETLFTLKDLEYAGLGLIRDENSYLSEDFIEEFDERYGMNEKKLENVDEIEEIVCRILNYHDVQADERAMRVLENLYFNVYLNLNPDEIYREEI
jgi:hypoxanthine phosphoribosyltransferase